MTLQSPTATLIPLFSSSELAGCGYPGLLDRKNRSNMCSRWESNPRLPACKANTLFTRPGSPGITSCVCVYSNSRKDVPRVAQRYGTIAAHTRRRASVLIVYVMFCVHVYSFAGLLRCCCVPILLTASPTPEPQRNLPSSLIAHVPLGENDYGRKSGSVSSG